MSRAAFWILGAAVLAIFAGGAYLVVAWNARNEPEPGPVPQDTFAPPTGGIDIGTTDGGSVTSRDFLNDDSVKPLAGNPDIVVLAGDYDFCVEGEACDVVATDEFNIRYARNDDSFVVGITREPIGEVRRTAESFLMEKTGLSEEEMCRLSYYVGTTYWVNETYAGQNLGFSFCPGAVKLP